MTDAAEATFLDVQDLIRWSVHRFMTRYGGEYEELVAEANVIFAELYNGNGRKFVRQGSRPFSSALAWLISHQLLDQLRSRIYRDNRCKVSYKEEVPERVVGHGSWIVDFMDELGDDARTIVSIILETPDTVLRDELEEFKDKNQKKVLGSYMSRLGWEWGRIKSCFQEIEEALS